MSTTLTAQTVAFIMAPDNLSRDLIFEDSGVQTAIGFSLGQNVLIGRQQYASFSGGLLPQVAFTLTFLVTATDAAAIVAGIPALKTRMANVQAGFTDIVTWGTPFIYN